MLEKKFARYARAVGDERERQMLFQKYKTAFIMFVIFLAICFAVIALTLLIPYIGDVFITLFFVGLIFAWIGTGIAAICLWVSFKSTYKRILQRPACDGEMPEVTAYREKSVQDGKTTFKKLWWAWLVFGICVAGFIVCIVIDSMQNPDGGTGVWGYVSMALLFIGVMTIFAAYLFYNNKKLTKGETLEQQTSADAQAIDRAQGRETEYNIKSDPNLQTYKYLFPDKELFAQAEAIGKKYTRVTGIAAITSCIVAMIAMFALLLSGYMGMNISGYAIPVAFTLIFMAVFTATYPLKRKLAAIELKQKEQLETNPLYAKNLEWYRLYESFSRFKGKIYVIFFIIGLALGWVLAILFPSTVWSLTALIPIVAGLFINNRLVRDLRQKAIPIEKEIDGQANPG